jgi:hypothetical protein
MRTWTDELFSMYIEGRLRPFSAREVRRAVDWIEARPEVIGRLEDLDDHPLRRELERLVRNVLRS